MNIEEMQEYYDAQLADAWRDKRWILAMDVYASMTGLVNRLDDYGVDEILCVAATRGAGTLPDEEIAPDPIVFDVRGDDMMSTIRASMSKLVNLPDEALARIDEFDPDRSAVVMGTIFDDGSTVAGRPKYGARSPEWLELEDKTRIDAVWDAVGVARAPSRVVAIGDLDAQREAVEELDEGAGTVWVADNREGFHGGASFVRHVQSESDAETVRAAFAPFCDSVRIMPFLEGLPCSIHGLVFDDYVVALRPCEMVVFRKEGTTEFLYGRAATFWDPPDEDRVAMRAMAKRVGGHLREEVDYRGAFTIDGVMTADGFRPTELNPRFGAALSAVARAAKLPLMLMNLAIVEGEEIDWHPRELEAMLLKMADANRNGGTMAVVTVSVEENESAELVFEDGVCRLAADGEEADVEFSMGPHGAGGILRAMFDPERTPVGPPVGPRAAAVLAFADEHWSLGIGRLIPARDVRS